MINLTYVINDNKITTNNSDDNIIIEEKRNGNRITVTLRALNDLMLYKATSLLDVKFADDSKFFMNGYQSWTDTKERYLNEYASKAPTTAKTCSGCFNANS